MRTSWQSSLPPRPWSTKIEKVEKVEKVTMVEPVELCWAPWAVAERRFRGRLLLGGITWPRFAPKLCQGLYHEGASCSNLDRCCIMSASKIVPTGNTHLTYLDLRAIHADKVFRLVLCYRYLIYLRWELSRLAKDWPWPCAGAGFL